MQLGNAILVLPPVVEAVSDVNISLPYFFLSENLVTHYRFYHYLSEDIC